MQNKDNKLSSGYLKEQLLKYNCANKNFEEPINQLIDIVGRIPDESIGEESGVVVREDNTLVFLVKHAKDKLRFIRVIFTQNNILTDVCFMKDSLYQRFAARKTQLSFPQFTKLYFESIFGTAFQKKIAYKKNKEVFECEWCFDNEALPNKLYISRKNKFIRFFTGAPKKNVQKFSYLSFFEVYDYEIKNIIIDRSS